MVRYIEDKESLSDFLSVYGSNRAAIFPIFPNRDRHPILTRPIGALVFIGADCWPVMESHNDTVSVPLRILDTPGGERWVFDTKWALHHFTFPTLSADAALWLSRWETIPYDTLYGRLTTPGRRISTASAYPITKMVEEIGRIVGDALTDLDLSPPGFRRFNDLILPTFTDIEKNGIPTTDGMEYGLYNNFTVTGRPTNGFGGVNYSALSRTDGSRDRIVSANGEFYQYDYDGYHIRLIARLIGESIPHPSAHEWLGCQYFGKETLTDEEYRESKAITFRQLYGGIDPEVMEIPFYKKTDQLIQKMYKEFIVNGFLETRFGKRIPHQRIPDHNPQKVFNYYLQALETETNAVILQQLNALLKGCRTKLTLYTYDSFTFDMHPEETDLIPQIETTLHQAAPTELKQADTYGKIG